VNPDTHKKLIYGAFGCGGLLAVLIVASWLFVAKSGFETPPSQPPVTPAQASAALDSLSTYDLAALIPVPPPLDARTFARWRTTSRPVMVFGDTFPPDSWQSTTWHSAGRGVVIESLPGRPPAPAESQPPGHAILAAARTALESGDAGRSRAAIRLAIQSARDLQARSDLLLVILGIRLERDAYDMIRRDAQLAESDSVRLLAPSMLAALDRRLGEVRQVRALIATSGATPAGASALTEWVLDSGVPLAVRDEIIRAIGFGWVLDPQEVSLGLDSERVAAVQRLAGVALPQDLQRTLRSATLGRPGITQRFDLAISYRTKRMESLDL
jgi:hypothetical protein